MNTKALTARLLGVIMLAFGCAGANAQIGYSNAAVGATLIYSNSFTGSGSVNITNTQADYEAGIFGGQSNTNWLEVLGGAQNGAFYADGTATATVADSLLLPFVPASNHVYIVSATINFLGNPGSFIGGGFAQNYAHQPAGNGRFNDAVAGYDWGAWTENTGVASFWAGGKTSNAQPSGSFNPHTGTHTLTFILDTTFDQNPGNKWTIVGFCDSVQMGTNYTFSSNPTLAAAGLTIFAQTTPANYQWKSFTLSAAQLVLVRPPASANVNQGAVFTNTVVVGGTPPFSYQWFTNGGAISGATNASLIINPVLPVNASTNYYVVVTNAYGAVTSAPAILTVNASPAFVSANPITYTNLMTLYGGTNNGVTTYLGSSPSFSVSAAGLQPITYQWLTNGVVVGGATNASFTFANCQWNSPTNFSCIASNGVGTATNAWAVQYVPAPTASYPQAVLAAGAIGYWRLNETNYDVNQYNNGQICNDYIGGNNGLYTNTVLAQPGYSPSLDPSETAAEFGYDQNFSSDANSIGTNIDFSAFSNAEFTVSIWANGGYNNGGTEPNPGGIVAKGYFNGEEFSLDNGSGGNVRFEVRSADGTAANASSTVGLGGDNNWHHLVGVCDESNGVVNLYIDGRLQGQASIAPGSGVYPAASVPIMIGARSTSASTYGDNQFNGALNDAAIFHIALSAAQVANLYEQAGGTVAPYLIPALPPTNVLLYAMNTTLTIPATASGHAPIGYYWTNLTTAAVLASGATNASATLDATLTIPDITTNWWGNTLELVVTNAYGSTNWFVTVSAPNLPPPPIVLDYGNAILYSNFFNASYDLESLSGTPATAVNSLVGGSNSVWICTYTNPPNGLDGTVYVDGHLGTNGGCALVPFTPEPGYIYTMTASLAEPATMGNWVAMGFSQNAAPTNNAGYARFTDLPNGYGWMYVQNGTSILEAGPKAGGPSFSLSGVPTAPTTNILQIVLNTITNNGWVLSASINGVGIGTNVYASNPPIAYAGIGQTYSPGSERWNYWTLTQTAPNGAPPYILSTPPPPTSITLLADSSLSIPVTAFSSFAPYGYTWSNTNTAASLGAGTTGTVAPLVADLSVAHVPSSWNGNTLALAVTNAYGTNVSLILLNVTNAFIIPTNSPGILTFTIVGGTNVMITGTNGQSGGTYYLLGSTNVAAPLSQWLPVATNVIVTNGSAANGFTFTGTNVVGNPQQFYILSNTNN